MDLNLFSLYNYYLLTIVEFHVQMDFDKVKDVCHSTFYELL